MSEYSDFIARREYPQPQPPTTGGVVVIVLCVLAAWELVQRWLA